MLTIRRAIGVRTTKGKRIEPANVGTEGVFINPAEFVIVEEYAGLRLAS
jgi:hypothetical protein